MIRIEAPIVANQVLASASAIFSWGSAGDHRRQPVQGGGPQPDQGPRARPVDAEVELLWPRLDAGLKLILLTGQRPGEVAAMKREHIVEGWWQMPGKPKARGRGRRTAGTTGSALSEPALALIESTSRRRAAPRSGACMRKIVAELGIEPATPHDLRRTCLTMITRLGFGRDAMDRVANHRTAR